MELRNYQTEAINEIARKSTQGKSRILLQLATGGGKTVMFSGLIHRFLTRQRRRVVICVHREELLRQARRTLVRMVRNYSRACNRRNAPSAGIRGVCGDGGNGA
jgi:superfamily II DNA or RNA helicase